MSDVLIVAIVGGVLTIVGTLAGTLVAGWLQKGNTQALIESEFKKLTAQISGESRARFRAKKEDLLLDAIADLLFFSDPEAYQRDQYEQILPLIHKVQIILDPRDPIEAKINMAVTELGLGFRTVDTQREGRKHLLFLQDRLIEATREFFRRT
ncbi:MAG: hypothetical protein AB1451_06410 [Nitrospirota bacterium]